MKGTLHDGQYTFSIMSRSVLLERKTFQTKVVDNFETHVISPVRFFFLENRAISEILWKNNVKRGRSQLTMGRIRIACWITKATDANSEYVIIIVFSTATVVARTRLNISLYVHCLS